MLRRGRLQVIDFLYRAIWHMDCSPPEASGWEGDDRDDAPGQRVTGQSRNRSEFRVGRARRARRCTNLRCFDRWRPAKLPSSQPNVPDFRKTWPVKVTNLEMNTNDNCRYDVCTIRCSRHSRQGADDRDRRLQSLAGAAGGALHSSVHRHGLRVQRVLAAAIARDRTECAEGVSGHVAGAGTLHHHVRLEGREHGLDVHVVLRAARHRRRGVGRLAGARGTAQGRLRLGDVLVRRSLPRRDRRLHASTVAVVARLGRDRRHRPRPRLHLAGIDAGEMVPGPPRHGDRHGHHGLWRRRHDRRAAGQPADELFQDRRPRSASGKPSSRWA